MEQVLAYIGKVDFHTTTLQQQAKDLFLLSLFPPCCLGGLFSPKHFGVMITCSCQLLVLCSP